MNYHLIYTILLSIFCHSKQNIIPTTATTTIIEENESEETNTISNNSSSYLINEQLNRPSYSFMTIFNHCISQMEIVKCFKKQAIRSLDYAENDNTVWDLNDYITLKRNPLFDIQLNHKNNTDLDKQLWNKILNILQSRSIQIKLKPDIKSEGRKKSKGGKYGGMLMTSGFAIGAMMLQLALGKIAFLAGAALLMAKMALIFSTLAAVKKMTGGGSSVQEWSGAGGHANYGASGGWQRSIEPINEDITYRGHYNDNDIDGA